MSTPIIIPCTADSFLRSGQATTTFGASSTLYCGYAVGTFQRLRPIFKFPVDSLAALTVDDIDRVLLREEVTVGSGNAFTYHLAGLDRNVPIDWPDCSWNNYDQSGGFAWNTAGGGGDFDDAPATDLVAPTNLGVIENDISATVLYQFENIEAFDHLALIKYQGGAENLQFTFRTASLENGAGKVVATLLVYLKDTGGASKKVFPPQRTRRRGT